MVSKMERLLYYVKAHMRKTSSIQIILVSIIIHSLISIFMIYLHLGWYFDAEDKKYEPRDLMNKDGGILFGLRQNEINLISSHVIEENEINYLGWWEDHYKWSLHVQCFNQKWGTCTRVITTQCKSDGIRAIYQHLPIRSDVTLQNIQFSARASAEQLVEQASEPLYGFHALLILSDGSFALVKLEFPSDSDGWIKRFVKYTSPPGTTIVEITTMLICYGYSGTVSFTDIVAMPLPESAKWGSSREAIIATCPSQSANVALYQAKYLIETILSPKSVKHEIKRRHYLTLVTQVSMDRMSVLEQTLVTWHGPVSLNIYISVKNMSEGVLEWQRLYVSKKIKNLGLHSESSVAIVVGAEDDEYPINTLRNLAIKNVNTRFMLLLDADFQPSPDIEKHFLSIEEKLNGTSGYAFVVPAFEYIDQPQKGDAIPKIKEEFLQLIHREDPLVQPFRLLESPDAHRLTNYWRWFNAESVYKVTSYSDKYEPYIIVEKSKKLPEFDERFSGYGMNKVTHATELYASNYTFMVLHNAWATHLPHKTSSYYKEFIQNAYHRLLNRAQRFQFIRNIIQKYRLHRECP